MMYEALQNGCLDIVPWYQDMDMKFIWFPYHDIGVPWHRGIAEVINSDYELDKLGQRIENIPDEEVQRRQKILKHVQPLFFNEGTHLYITYMVTVAQKADTVWKDLGMGESKLGRAVDMVRNKHML